MLDAVWQPIVHPSAAVPLCQYVFPVCVKLRPKDGTDLGSYLPPSLAFTPDSTLRSQYSGALGPLTAHVLVGSTTLNSDVACANISISPQLAHAGHTLSVSVHVW